MKTLDRRRAAGKGRATSARRILRSALTSAPVRALAIVFALALLSAALHLPLDGLVAAFLGVARAQPRS